MKTLHTSGARATQAAPSRSAGKKVPFSAILVVYKSKEGFWKGFAHPYDVMAHATTKSETLKRLKELTDIFHDEIKKYGFPRHLINQPLTDLEDQEVFNEVVNDMLEKKGLDQNPSYYAETYQV